ncbi:hypothetical protein [Methylobacterium sp. P5_C11]
MPDGMTDRSPDPEAGTASPEAQRPGLRPEAKNEADQAEREKTETEIAAGDVADDLADFA